MKALVGECYHKTYRRAAREFHEFIWKSDAAGLVTFVVEDLRGLPSWLETRPFSGVTPNYAVVLENAAGADVLLGGGANRSASATELAFISAAATGPAELRRCTCGPHTLRISGAGAGACGVALLCLVPAEFLDRPEPRVAVH